MANIITGRTPEYLIKMPKTRIQGLVGWELVRNGIVERFCRPRPNLIVDSGLNALGGTILTDLIMWCGVGTDNTAPAVGQTTLVSPTGDRTNSAGGFGDVTGVFNTDEYAYIRRTRVFTESEVNGNLTEVGFFTAEVAGTMFNRQLLTDDLGAPTTIVKTSSHQLRIIIEVRISVDLATLQQLGETITGDGGGSVDVETKAIAINNLWHFGQWSNNTSLGRFTATNTMPAFGGQPSGSADNASSVTHQTYTTNNFFRDTLYVAEPSVANHSGGIGGLWWGSIFLSASFSSIRPFMTTFTPKIVKGDTKRLRIFTRTSWVRV
jgi:hypothetical protein